MNTDLDTLKARAESITLGQINIMDEMGISVIRAWYSTDLPFLLNEVEKLENKNLQLKTKLEKGPCGKCRQGV